MTEITTEITPHRTKQALIIITCIFIGFCFGYVIGQLDCYKYLLSNAKL